MNVKEISELKPGDVIFECEYGKNLRVEITTKPKCEIVDINGKRKQFTWTARVSGGEIEYRWTEGFSHYGPRLYREPQYISIHSGNIEAVVS